SVRLVESGGGLQPPGGSLRLVCDITDVTNVTDDVIWLRQPPGKGLEWVTSVRRGGSDSSHEAVVRRGRVTAGGGRGRSGVTVTLRVDDVTAGDTATYYCAR
ncbi:HV05 protein, partial [Pterocles burchelli]|nr:HV05 protein [Pterocles burchelli]